MGLRILWVSNAPWAPTGYGNQTGIFVPRLQAAGHSMGIFAFYGLQGRALKLGDIPVYPGVADAYGNDMIIPHARDHKADIVITLIDAWVLRPEILKETRWVAWAPVDHEPIPPPVVRSLSPRNQRGERLPGAWRVVAYSRHAQRLYKEIGIEAAYVPHGVDSAIYYPVSRDEARDKLSLPKDAFIVGMVAANKGNPSRKGFAEAFEAFVRFRSKRPDAKLYCHSEIHGMFNGVNLPELVQMLNWRFRGMGGVPEQSVIFTDQYKYKMGLPEEQMRLLYNAFDVLINPAYGEGFGLPVVEAQMCGTPVIVTDFSAMSELCFGGWRVGGQLQYDSQASWWMVPSINKLTQALHQAYDLRGVQSKRDKVREEAMQFDANLVTEQYWLPFLDDVEREISAGNGAPPASEVFSEMVENQPQEAPV